MPVLMDGTSPNSTCKSLSYSTGMRLMESKLSGRCAFLAPAALSQDPPHFSSRNELHAVRFLGERSCVQCFDLFPNFHFHWTFSNRKSCVYYRLCRHS